MKGATIAVLALTATEATSAAAPLAARPETTHRTPTIASDSISTSLCPPPTP